jgi:hypothetical protein
MMPHRHEPGSKAATLRDLRRRTQCTRRAAQKIGGVARP